MNKVIVICMFVGFLVGNIFAQGYLQIGADPVNVTHGLNPGRMWVKYSEDLVGYTNSHSGKWSFGKIRAGEILDISINDYNNDAVQDATIAHCGNDFYVPAGGSAHTLPRKKKLDKSKIQVIVSYDQLVSQGGCITEEQYNQLRSDHEFIVSQLGDITVVVNETNQRTKSIQELILQMKDRMKAVGDDDSQDESSEGSPFWTTVKWVGLAAIIAWLTYEVIKLLKDNGSSDGGGGNQGGPAPDPWNVIFSPIQVRF